MTNITAHCDTVFDSITGQIALVGREARDEANAFLRANAGKIFDEAVLREVLLSTIARKLKLNEERIRNFFKMAANMRIPLNYFQKEKVRTAFDLRDINIFGEALSDNQTELENLPISFATDDDVLQTLKFELKAPLNRRTKVRDPQLASDLITAIYSEFVFRSIPLQEAQRYFDQEHESDYLKRVSKDLSHFRFQDPSLTIGFFDNNHHKHHVRTFIHQQYKGMRNHSHMILVLSMEAASPTDTAWALAQDAMLYAEKGFSEVTTNAYYKKDKIKSTTAISVPGLDLDKCDFDRTFFGFQYLDCFVVKPNPSQRDSKLVLVFELNKKDEAILICPTCRGRNVEGNSYSKLGVRSWECANLICADRSRSNRGRRYSLYSTLRQQSLLDPQNSIPRVTVKHWNRDVVEHTKNDEIEETMIQFFSSAGDLVLVKGAVGGDEILGRRVLRDPSSTYAESRIDIPTPYLNRLTLATTPSNQSKSEALDETQISGQRILLGDSTSLMLNFKKESIDCAITSPPYYNAREYSQWENIYGYINDMRANAQGVLASLKKGGIYFYNIFDYFDNENDIVFSAMGQKRLVLSAQTVRCFESAGFTFVGNIPWDKGHIEGKRGFNGGNFGPFFQQPFNCWEHILVFSKGEPNGSLIKDLPFVLQAKPVLKMVRGQNIHGHTAPFPLEIPDLATKRMSKGMTILDPFGGSCTTAISAMNHGVKSICIEQSPEYYSLACNLVSQHAFGLSG